MNATFEIDRDYYKNIYCTVSEYSTCDPHFHSNIEIVYLMEGELDVTINGISKKLSAGCVSVSNSYDIHSYHTPSYSKSKILIIPTDIVKSFSTMSQTLTFAYPFLDVCEETEDIDHATDQLIHFNDTRDSMTAKGHIYVVLGTLISKLGFVNRLVESNSETLMRSILIYLEKNCLEHLTISDLAKEFGYNKSYLSRLFNSSLGCGFNQYINVLRARHAASLIQNTKNSLMEISYQSGFRSSRTFTRAFKEFYKMTPLEYKQRNNSKANK